MSLRQKLKKQDVDIADLYAMKAGTLWAALRNEHLSFWMLCVYFMFEYVRPQALYPSLDVLPWAQIFLIAAVIAAILDPSVKWVGHAQNRLMLLFTVVIVLSGMFGFHPAISAENWTVFGGWLLVYFLVITIVNSEQRVIIFVCIYCLFSLKMSQHGAIGWAQRGFSFASWGLVGSPGWFRNSGEYAIQMLIFASLATSLVIGLRAHWGRYKRWVFYAVTASGYMAIMGASSRGAQLALVVIAIWWVLKLKGGFKAVVIISILCVLLWNILPEEQLSRFSEMGEDSSSLQRLAYWDYALNEIIPNHPFLGIGYMNWMPYVTYMVPEGLGPGAIIQVSHNIYIEAASELGLTGLAVFALLIMSAFITGYKTRKIAKENSRHLIYCLSYGLEAGLIGYLVAGCFVTVLFYPFFWVQISMIVMLHNIVNSKVQNI